MTARPPRLTDEQLSIIATSGVFPEGMHEIVVLPWPPATTVIAVDQRDALLAEVRAGRELRRKLRVLQGDIGRMLADEESDHGRHEAMSTHTTDFDGSVPLTLAPDRPLPPSPTNERDTLEQPKAVELRTIPSLISREEVLRVLREMAEASPSPWWPAALTTAIARIEALK